RRERVVDQLPDVRGDGAEAHRAAGTRLAGHAGQVDERQRDVVEVTTLVRVAAERDGEPEALLLVVQEHAERVRNARRIRGDDREEVARERLEVREALWLGVEEDAAREDRLAPDLRAVRLLRRVALVAIDPEVPGEGQVEH